MFKHVPDGIYDHAINLVRYEVVGGKPRKVISKMWLDKGGPDNVSDQLKKPWGSYPNIPAKPAK